MVPPVTVQSKGESDMHLYIRKEEILYRQAQMRTSTDTREREGDRQTDRHMFNETRNCCMTHYDHSVWPASNNDG